MTDPASSSYDELPYVDKAFPQTHPDRLAALARLFGVAAPDVETCRVLELGCASGDNLIPMALGLPRAHFTGIDFSVRQIERGQHSVAALGLTNIDLRHADIADVDASWGRFDYIVCHGIYSWVPAPIRDKVLAICKQNLAANGVAFVSYNTYPGWRPRQMLRDMMVYHTEAVAGARAKVTQARGLLDFMAQNVPADTPYGMTLRQEAERTRGEDDAYVFHEYLEEVNHPLYFHQFASAARDRGLQYLAEADFSTMLLSNFPAPIAAALQQVSADIVRLEQYMDFFRSRTFRQTLLTHLDVGVRRQIEPQMMQAFQFASGAQAASATPSYAQGAPETFRAPRGAALTTGSAITKAAMRVLHERWPLAVPFAELARSAREFLTQATGTAADAATLAQDAPQLCMDLLRCYAVNIVELRLRSPQLAVTASARPIASPLARMQAGAGRPLTNLRHEPVALDEAGRRVLQLLDGTRDRDALVGMLAALAREGRLQVPHGGGVLAEGPNLEAILRRGLEANLAELARAGLLVA